MDQYLPRILIIDDLFGRTVPSAVNEDRENLCASFLLKDVTNNDGSRSRQRIKEPIAQAVFCRGQQPECASVGDTVENDLNGTMDVIRQGWVGSGEGFNRWSLVLLDLCFYTGKVTGSLSSAIAGDNGKQAEPGMPEGRAEDIVAAQFFGLKLLRAIHTEFPDLPVVILSSQERGKASEEFSAHGALAFLPRSEGRNPEVLLKKHLDRHGLMEDPHGLIVGRSLPLLKALRAARRTAYKEERDNILIRGERGVGKEEFARFIHRIHPNRAMKEFVPVNSAVLTAELFQSVLFGIGKGVASTVDKRDGLAFQANKGDLFFDEIKDMIPQAQAGILRFLEDGGFTPTGEKLIESDVRVISATNADLESLAASGHFREDLLDRLRRGGSLVLPPLRERKDDIPLLADAFVRQAEATKRDETFHRQFSDEALACLAQDDWPGNVRVLQDVLKKVVSDNDVEYIFPAHIEKAKRDLGVISARSVSVAVPHSGEAASITPQSVATSSTDQYPNDLPVPTPDISIPAPQTLHDLIAMLQRFEFDPQDRDALRGRLDELDEAAAGLVIQYLLAALDITREPVSGELVPTKAIQFVTGKKKLKTSSAYDMIKRLLKRHKSAFQTALSDPTLKAVFEQAEANRPANRGKKKAKGTPAP